MTTRTLGLLGGMSWQSTAVYYRLINEGVARRLGGLHSAPLLLHSVDFAAIAALQAAADWSAAAGVLAAAAAGLKRAGAGALVLATNTMHKAADRIETEGGLPLLHIADATAAALQAAGVRHAALLGTRFTMTDRSIVADRLAGRHGLHVLHVSVPDEADRELVHRVIYEELCRGIVSAASRAALLAVIERQRLLGATAVILGCTELTLSLDAICSPLPVFDTTLLHATAAIDWLLDEQDSRGDTL